MRLTLQLVEGKVLRDALDLWLESKEDIIRYISEDRSLEMAETLEASNDALITCHIAQTVRQYLDQEIQRRE